MNEKNEFDILENTEQSVIDRLSAEFPPNDAEEKEKVFRMSERKFNIANTQTEKFTETDEQTVSGVDIYKRPLWKKLLSTAAAAAIIIGGTAGGIKAYRHFADAPAPSEEEAQVAPFGDFAELDYKLCDFDADTMQKIIIRDTPEEYSYFELFSGSDISLEKRRKLADFFNNYDYGESLTEAEQLQAGINKSLEDIDEENEAFSEGSDSEDTDPDSFINETAEVPVIPETSDDAAEENTPYFIYNSGSEVRAVKIYDVGEFGVLNYTHFSYSEDNGELVMTDDEISTDAWKINYDLFKSTISDILGTEEKTTEETTTKETTAKPAADDGFEFIEYDDYYKTAPFGDFAELDYQLCNFSTYTYSPRTIDEESVEHAHRLGISNINTTTNLPPCDEIPLEYREKLAELFNSWDFDKTPQKSYVYDPETDKIILTKKGKTYQLDSMDSEDLSDHVPSSRFQSNADAIHLSPINPYMIYETADEIRLLSFMKFDDEGYLTYCRIKFEDIDGTKYLFNDTISLTSYAIDYDYFVDTMDAIFADEEYTIKKGTMALKGDTDSSDKLNPLSGFANKEYWIYNSYKGNIDELPNVFISTESGLSYNASPRPALDPEKRRELEDFFGSLTWTERSADDTERKSAVDNDETVTFDMLTDTEFSRIMLNLGSNTISVDTMPVEKLDGGDENYMQYRCTDQASHSMNLYSTDYPDMREKLQEILGDDFGTNKTFVKKDQ